MRSVEVEPTPELLDAIADTGDGEALAARISKSQKVCPMSVEKLLEAVTADPAFADRLKADPTCRRWVVIPRRSGVFEGVACPPAFEAGSFQGRCVSR